MNIEKHCSSESMELDITLLKYTFNIFGTILITIKSG